MQVVLPKDWKKDAKRVSPQEEKEYKKLIAPEEKGGLVEDECPQALSIIVILPEGVYRLSGHQYETLAQLILYSQIKIVQEAQNPPSLN